MDNRLERIRLYKGNVMDFDSYIKDRIEQTKKENSVGDSERKKRLRKKLDKLNENLMTHDDEYNLYDKLDELDIDYDSINDYDNILEIDTPDAKTKNTVMKLLNYYGWKAIKVKPHSVFAERIYGDKWNSYVDTESQDENKFPCGKGIYYHVTETRLVNKILKKGLVAKEGGKLGYKRGERIYLMSYPSESYAKQLFRNETGYVDVTILLVEIDKYLGKNINIYHDDLTSDDGAVYTYDYIPPECISIWSQFRFKV